MRTRLISTILLPGLLCGGPALAADNGIYLGGSIGQSKTEFDDRVAGQPIDFDADTTGYKLIAGWRFLDWLSVEGNWIDFGSASDRVPVQGGNLKIESDLDGVSVSVVGFLPIGPIDLFARAGVFNWDGSLNSGALAGKGSDDGTDLTYGVGAQFRLLSLSLRAEYERFDVDALDNADMISVGLTYTFL